MHWFWRATIAVVVGVLCQAITIPLGHLPIPAAPASSSTLDDRLASFGVFLGLASHRLLPLLVAVVVYASLTHYYGRTDIETRCRKCGYILRGITEPRCPECGERI